MLVDSAHSEETRVVVVRGNRIEEANYGPDGKLMISRSGFALVRTSYDARGNVTEHKMLGVDERPIAGRENVATYVYKGLGFFEADEIQDAVALLRYLADPHSNLRAATLLRSRIIRLSDAGLAALAPELATAILDTQEPAAFAALSPEDQRVLARLTDVGLARDVDKMPGNLSGGMRKRAGLARAMALDPPLLLVDEPSAGLDPLTALEIDDLLLARKRAGTTLVVVTHNIPSARLLADEIAVLHEGRVIASGTVAALDASADPLVQAFMRSQGGG